MAIKREVQVLCKDFGRGWGCGRGNLVLSVNPNQDQNFQRLLVPWQVFAC